MDFVMINQLPELALARNRGFPQTNTMTVTTKEKRNPYLSKWHALFDSTNEQWISFQPRIGRIAYPCFACRDMFGNRSSFLDHINRRSMILKYYCWQCEKYLTFYNVCSFLLYTRQHFTETGGSIDLEKVDISTISMDVAGFMPHPDYPRLYDVEDTPPNYNLNLNIKFYRPKEESMGQRLIYFEPNELIFHCTIRNAQGIDEIHSMMLCQICTGIPKCEFMSIIKPTSKTTPPNSIVSPKKEVGTKTCNNNNAIKDKNPINNTPIVTPTVVPAPLDKNHVNMMMEADSDDDIISIHTVPDEVICLDDDSSDEEPVEKHTAPKEGIQVKNLKYLLQSSLSNSSEDEELRVKLPVKKSKLENKIPHCHECNEEQAGPMKDHFQKNDKPVDDDIKCIKCSLILPSHCSLQAHIRIHDRISPYVCPECGKGFDLWNKLFAHMEDVCFHLAKHIRYKCPARKCGKIFAQTVTFSTHFPLQHIAIRYTCDICAETFNEESEFEEHSKIHTFTKAIPVTSYECSICTTYFDTFEEHVKEHCHDRDNRIYVYTCKYCKSYYRSKNTYAAHLLRCTKLLLNTQVKKEAEVDKSKVQCKVVRFCRKCNSQIQFHCTYKEVKSIGKTCPQCHTIFGGAHLEDFKSQYSHKDGVIIQKEIDTSEEHCILCKTQLNPRVKHNCKYQNPAVVLNRSLHVQSPILVDTSPDSSVSEDSVKRKKKRYHSPLKYKKPVTEEPYDMTPIKPMVFEGEYLCNLCDYKSESREQFHEHIQKHRDISTAYQCMECGECFVVKPSLIKHLQVFHLIENVESYINENSCFDKDAVRELQENMRMIPGETKEPVAENQCRVCRQMFSDQLELSKHFRVHGMAFLMKKIIPNK